MRLLAFALSLTVFPISASALDMVTNPRFCDLDVFDRQEQTMTFDGKGFYEIEYSCTITPPLSRLSWTRSETFVRMGYCEEPGALYPDVFVFRLNEHEQGILQVYQGDSGAPQTFHLCRQ